MEGTEIELTIPYEGEDAQLAGESLAKIIDNTNLERLVNIANFMESHPEEVKKIERWVQNPPSFLKAFL